MLGYELRGYERFPQNMLASAVQTIILYGTFGYIDLRNAIHRYFATLSPTSVMDRNTAETNLSATTLPLLKLSPMMTILFAVMAKCQLLTSTHFDRKKCHFAMMIARNCVTLQYSVHPLITARYDAL